MQEAWLDMKVKQCKDCDKDFNQYQTTVTRCPHCTAKRYNKPRKPVKRIGRVMLNWRNYRNDWIRRNPPDRYGYWICEVRISDRCLGRIDKDQLTLDHIIPKSRRPDLRYEDSNIQPACIYCNGEKASNVI